jgi:hypothetical protein
MNADQTRARDLPLNCSAFIRGQFSLAISSYLGVLGVLAFAFYAPAIASSGQFDSIVGA